MVKAINVEPQRLFADRDPFKYKIIPLFPSTQINSIDTIQYGL